jgi:3-methyladenine DNA glycosylase AlkD
VPPSSTDAVLAALDAAADPKVRAEMGTRYGIHTGNAMGVPMARMKAIAKPLGTDHALAAELWASGSYEARIVASLVDDAAAVTPGQMDEWCAAFDNWAIVDGVCFNLFDRTAHAWDKVDRWASDDREFVKRAAFALLWSLALHRKDAADDRFRHALAHVEANAGDRRHLVSKAISMSVRAIVARRPALRDDVAALADRLAAAPDRAANGIGRAAVRDLARAEP